MLASYTRGLNTIRPEDIELKRDLHRNRSQASLLLDQYDNAKADALASLTASDDHKSKLLDSKALYRAGRAAYQLQEFDNARELFEQVLSLSPLDKDGIRERQRTGLRLQEQQKGFYDFEAIAKAIPKTNFRADTASFLAGTSIRQTENHGRGAFATRDYLPGDLILCEKAFNAAHENDKHTHRMLVLNLDTNRGLMGTQATVWMDAVQHIFDNPSSAPQILDLHAGSHSEENTELKVVDGLPVVDAFLVQRLIKYNSFGFMQAQESGAYCNTARGDEDTTSTGLWSRAAYMNHSCLFNGERSFVGDLIIVRAAKEIPEGTEITLPYLAVDPNTQERQSVLLETWGFRCDCRLCAIETHANIRRDILVRAVTSFLKNNPLDRGPFPSKQIMETAEKLARDMELTYSADAFQNMPHLAAIPLYEWLCQANALHATTTGLGHWACALLRSHGYRINVHASQVNLDRSNGILTSRVVDALIYLCGVYRKQSPNLLSTKLKEMAREMYRAINGVSTGFEDRYGDEWFFLWGWKTYGSTDACLLICSRTALASR